MKNDIDLLNNNMAYFVELNNLPQIEQLLKKGANNFDECLARAARKGNIEIVKIMLVHGANNFATAAHFASTNNHFEILSILTRQQERKKNAKI